MYTRPIAQATPLDQSALSTLKPAMGHECSHQCFHWKVHGKTHDLTSEALIISLRWLIGPADKPESRRQLVRLGDGTRGSPRPIITPPNEICQKEKIEVCVCFHIAPSF